MEPLSFIAKFIGAAASVCAAFALAALGVYLGRRSRIEFFVNLDQTIYQAVVIGGLFCACVVIVESCIALVKWIRPKGAKWLATRASVNQKKATALKNLAMINREYAETLRFLKAGNVKRFPAPGFNTLLNEMRDAYLLEIDDPFGRSVLGAPDNRRRPILLCRTMCGTQSTRLRAD